MPSIRIEYIKIQQSNNELYLGADNVISGREADSVDLTITGTATTAGSRPVVPNCDAVRLTSIGGVAYVDWGSNPTASAAKGVRLAAEMPEVVAIKKGSLISAITGA